MSTQTEAMKLALEALEYIEHNYMSLPAPAEKAITALREALAEQPAQQEPVAAECNFVGTKEWGRCSIEHHNLVQSEPHKWPGYQTRLLYTSHQPAQQEPEYAWPTVADYERDVGFQTNEAFRIAWNMARTTNRMLGHTSSQPAQQEPVGRLESDPDEGHVFVPRIAGDWTMLGEDLYTSPPAQRPHECSRSHPHENMNAMCELRTEIARLTNENARLKAMHQDDEINTYRMTLLCIRDGLQQGMSKSIQKLQAREINDVLGLPSFASYRTSPPAQRKPLTDEQIDAIWDAVITPSNHIREFVRAIEAAHGIKEKT